MTTRDLLLPEARLENLSDEFLECVSALISSKMVWLGGGRHNNGLRPTADTNDVIYFQRLGAAGDAGR